MLLFRLTLPVPLECSLLSNAGLFRFLAEIALLVQNMQR